MAIPTTHRPPAGVADDAPAFRKAIAYLMAHGGGTVVVPPRDYLLNSFDPTPPSTDEYVALKVGTDSTIPAKACTQAR